MKTRSSRPCVPRADFDRLRAVREGARGLLAATAALAGLSAPACDHGLVGVPIDGEAAAPTEPASPPVADEALIAPKPYGFSWVEVGVLAGLAHPAASSLGVDGSLDWLAGEGVRLLVSLTLGPIAPEDLEAHGLDGLHLPVVDFTPPSLDQMFAFVSEVSSRREQGEPVAVHCGAGLGRTGTMLAAWFVNEGLTADEAIVHVRTLRPGSVETLSQEDAVRSFEAVLHERRPLRTR